MAAGSMFARALRRVRPEEGVLLGTWLVGVLLCSASGADSQSYAPVFQSYVYFFGRYVVYLFVATRLLLLLDERWQPRAVVARRLKSWLYGVPPGGAVDRLDRLVVGAPLRAPRPGVLAVDLEFLRLALLLFANLTVYSNIKTHIPFINATVGDEAFRQLDVALFGSLIESVERWFADHPGVARYFERIYMHDYVWMVALAFVLYVRRDVFSLRWAFTSVCLVYLVGILITVAYPSYGPFYVDADRFAWLRPLLTGKVQASLAFFHDRSAAAVAAGGGFEARAFMGIAAFPSLHVAHMAIVAHVAVRTAPLLAAWMLWMTTATFIATIGFGWHYAVDGVGGILLAVGITEAVYRALRRGTIGAS